MAGSRRRRQLQRQRERGTVTPAAAATTTAASPAAPGKFQIQHLPADLLREIHHRLAFMTRLAFASVCGASGHHLKPETPWLILPKENDQARATVRSIADGNNATATVRISDVAMSGHVAIGSSGGWLVTADDRGALRMANPATGAHADLPTITTVPFIHPLFGGHWFSLYMEPFLQFRFGGQSPPPTTTGRRDDMGRTYTVTKAQMRQVFYRKVVLSASPRPDSYAAMLIMDKSIGAPAFATTEDAHPSWRMARSADAVEDAIHHDGRFVSITYTGRVEAWQRDAETGEFTSEEVAPRLEYENQHLHRRYIAASTDGRLMAVLKHAMHGDIKEHGYSRGTCTRVFFKVQMLDRVKGRWAEVADIGDSAIFVGVNGSLCLSTREHHQGISPGCIYFTDDDVGGACIKKANCQQQQRSYSYGQASDAELRDVGVYNLKSGKRGTLHAAGDQLWPPAAWFTPSFL